MGTFIYKIFTLIKKRLKWRFSKNIVIGSGSTKYNGWLSTNKNSFNITIEKNFSNFWKKNSISKLLAEHVWEHLTDTERNNANKNCFNYLKPNGRLRIAVPDGFHPSKDYIDKVKPGGSGKGADEHKILFNYISLKKELEQVGFRVKLLEYWDENGNFNYKNWDLDYGYIERSKNFDPRNQNGELNYTSLIVDAIK